MVAIQDVCVVCCLLLLVCSVLGSLAFVAIVATIVTFYRLQSLTLTSDDWWYCVNVHYNYVPNHTRYALFWQVDDYDSSINTYVFDLYVVCTENVHLRACRVHCAYPVYPNVSSCVNYNNQILNN